MQKNQLQKYRGAVQRPHDPIKACCPYGGTGPSSSKLRIFIVNQVTNRKSSDLKIKIMTDLPTWLVPATAIISSLARFWQSPEVHGDLSSNITNHYLNLKISNYIWLVPNISNYSRVIFMSSICI